jgi:dipeptidyl aminopeptidase/acylaminoacyl peptidase
MKKFNIILSLLFVAIHVFSQTEKTKILVTDLLKIKQIGNIKVSPDGKSAIYTLKTIEQNTDNSLEYDYRTHLWITDFNTTRQLTQGSESVSQMTWAADSKKIAFLRNTKGKSQVFIMPLNGGEGLQITDYKYSIGNINWSPDGTKILFTASVGLNDLLADSLLNPTKSLPKWPFEKPGFENNANLVQNKNTKANPDGTLEEIRAYLSKNETDKKAKVINRLNFQGESTTEPEMSFTQLLTVEAMEKGKIEPLITGFQSVQSAAWSISGKGIYYTSSFDPKNNPDKEQDAAIYNFDLSTKTNKMIIGKKGMQYTSPILSNDGNFLAIKNSPTQGINFGKLAVLNLSNNKIIDIDFDRNAGGIKWSDDDKYLYFTAQSNGGQPLYKYDIKLNKTTQLSDYETGIIDFDLYQNKIVFHKTNIKNPSELFVSDITLKNEKQVTLHNNWVKNRQLVEPTKYRHTDNKGFKIEYWLMKPANINDGKKHPLLLNMHGGPTAMWGPGEQSMWHELQYMCAQGYGIVYANPRGSGGYGLNFQKANFQDWGNGPAEDVLTAATLAAKESWVDTSRQVITGGSYAGYLTAWIVGHDHRFKAAFSQRGVYDLTTFMGEGNAWRLTPQYFGLPWVKSDFDLLKSESPYTYVDKITTPLLIKHGENDLRTGVIQSEMLYKSMKYLGKDVEYVRMPGATHELSRAGNVRQRIDRLLRIYEFFERYIGTK